MRRSRAASLTLCLPLVSPGCYMFYPRQPRVGNAVREERVSRGADAGEVRAVLGDPWRVAAEGAEESWVYRERWADGVDISGQIYLGLLTLGIFWLVPPEPDHHEVIFRDGRAVAIIRLGSSPPDVEPRSRPATTVTTDPPRARIEVDGTFVGHSPLRLSWIVPVHGGRFLAEGEHIVAARLEAPPHTRKEARIRGGKFVFEGSDRIPPEIHFDLKTPPEAASQGAGL